MPQTRGCKKETDSVIMDGNSENFYGLMVLMKKEECTEFSVNAEAIDSVFFRFEELGIQAWMLRI